MSKMESSVSTVYDIVKELNNFILQNPTSNKICFHIYTTYKSLLSNRLFMNEVLNVNSHTLKYFKLCVSQSQKSDEERDYFFEKFLNVTNLLMLPLLNFIRNCEPTDTVPLTFVSDNWPSLNEYWYNTNRNSAFDEDWIRSLMKLSAPARPLNFKLVYKMFVLSWVIRHEILGQKLPNYSTLPQFKQIYNQCCSRK